MFLLSESLRPFISLPAYRSDHTPIILQIDFSKFKRGAEIWKHISKLLKDINYVKAINQTIKNTYAKYIKDVQIESSPVEFQNFMDMEIEMIEQMELNINPHVFLEMVLNDIKNESINYASAINRANRARENKLLNDVKILQDEITGGI